MITICPQTGARCRSTAMCAHEGCSISIQLSPGPSDATFQNTVLVAKMQDEIAKLTKELAASQEKAKALENYWITDRLPEWATRDDTTCVIDGKNVGATLTSETVLVALDGGGIRTDKLIAIEGSGTPWWDRYGKRVIAWMPAPAHPNQSAAALLEKK